MARAHRIGQKSHVSVYRFVSKDTVEEDVLERAKQKMILEYASKRIILLQDFQSELNSITVVGQMDTTQEHLSAKPKKEKEAKKGDIDKEELTAVLKYGAQKMYA